MHVAPESFFSQSFNVWCALLQKTDLHDGLVDDYADFQKLCGALSSIGLNAKDLNSIFQIIAALLHLGNVHFVDNVDDRKGIQICDLSSADWAEKPSRVRQNFAYKEFLGHLEIKVRIFRKIPQNFLLTLEIPSFPEEFIAAGHW